MGAQPGNDNAKKPENQRKIHVIRFKESSLFMEWLSTKGNKSASQNAHDLLRMIYLAETMGGNDDNQNQ